ISSKGLAKSLFAFQQRFKSPHALADIADQTEDLIPDSHDSSLEPLIGPIDLKLILQKFRFAALLGFCKVSHKTFRKVRRHYVSHVLAEERFGGNVKVFWIRSMKVEIHAVQIL